jgi:dephospho-CoA kinase
MAQKNTALIVGLTGGIATGKTTYTVVFKKLGAQIVCCDEIAHRALRKHTKTYNRIVKAFGSDILKPTKQIDRAKLATVIFNNQKKRKELEGIVHPYVFKRLDEKIKKTRGILVIEVPLLFETGFDKAVDKTILVWCSRRDQIKRIVKRDGGTEAWARKRIEAQMPLTAKKRKADFVIDNSVLDKGVKQAINIWKKLQKEKMK